jgi:hypothetical protein
MLSLKWWEGACVFHVAGSSFAFDFIYLKIHTDLFGGVRLIKTDQYWRIHG